MSLVTSVIISWTTIPLLRRASMILLQNPPRDFDVDIVKEKVSQVLIGIGIYNQQLILSCLFEDSHRFPPHNFETCKLVNARVKSNLRCTSEAQLLRLSLSFTETVGDCGCHFVARRVACRAPVIKHDEVTCVTNISKVYFVRHAREAIFGGIFRTMSPQPTSSTLASWAAKVPLLSTRNRIERYRS